MAWHRYKVNSIGESKIAISIVIGVLLGCVIIFTIQYRQISKSSFQIGSSSEQIEKLKSEIAAMQETNSELKKQVEEYLAEKLQLAEQQKAGPFGTVKALPTNPTVTPDDSVNPRLANILKKLAVQNELIVTLANSNVKDVLEVWFTNIKRVGIPNYLVIALDDQILELCKSNNVPVYKRDPDEVIDAVGRSGGVGAVSTLKFTILREFLQLGYSVLISDVDIIYLQNPFQHLIRDSDVESMTDGHDNNTAYGYDDVFDNSDMGWSNVVYTTRIWVYNCGFFHIRPTIPAIELLDRVTHWMTQQPNLWDQVVYNEELFFPSHPGYHGLYASKRTMDFYKFMNSKVLFKTVRKDINLKINLKPVIVHINYHPDKLARMKAVEEFYVNGKQDALDPFPDGSE